MQLNLILVNRKRDSWELGDITKSKSSTGFVENPPVEIRRVEGA